MNVTVLRCTRALELLAVLVLIAAVGRASAR